MLIIHAAGHTLSAQSVNFEGVFMSVIFFNLVAGTYAEFKSTIHAAFKATHGRWLLASASFVNPGLGFVHAKPVARTVKNCKHVQFLGQ